MKIIKKIVELQNEIARYDNARVGLVPTMGALHQGHLSLVKKCVQENDICVVSIFVNPTQFNDKTDLEKYPRNLEKDAELLQTVNCSIIFAPSVEEIYPIPDERKFGFGSLETVMEGKFRPGHFNGVAQIVSKLFAIVKPNVAYFGEKDFQQLAIIRAMVKQLGLKVKIQSCPIIREKSGLAMSSRNALLTEIQREKASLIHKVLSESCTFVPQMRVTVLVDWVISQFSDDSEFKIEYFDVVDGYTLQSIGEWSDADYVVGCIAIFCGKVRLIDNIQYKK